MLYRGPRCINVFKGGALPGPRHRSSPPVRNPRTSEFHRSAGTKIRARKANIRNRRACMLGVQRVGAPEADATPQADEVSKPGIPGTKTSSKAVFYTRRPRQEVHQAWTSSPPKPVFPAACPRASKQLPLSTMQIFEYYWWLRCHSEQNQAPKPVASSSLWAGSNGGSLSRVPFLKATFYST